MSTTGQRPKQGRGWKPLNTNWLQDSTKELCEAAISQFATISVAIQRDLIEKFPREMKGKSVRPIIDSGCVRYTLRQAPKPKSKRKATKDKIEIVVLSNDELEFPYVQKGRDREVVQVAEDFPDFGEIPNPLFS